MDGLAVNDNDGYYLIPARMVFARTERKQFVLRGLARRAFKCSARAGSPISAVFGGLGLTSWFKLNMIKGCRLERHSLLLFDNRIGNQDVRGELVDPMSVRDVGESLTRTIH